MARSDDIARLFECPARPVHRRFEVCRAYFRERLTASVIAKRFGLHPGSVQAMVRDFAAHPDLDAFFVSPRPGRKTSPKREALGRRAEELRRQGQTLAQIHEQLTGEGHHLCESYLARILREGGFALLRRRRPPALPGERARDGSEVFAGLNVLPKATYATDYSYQTERAMNERLVDALVARLPLGEPPQGFNLDFHAIPFRGLASDLENHWVPKSHRGQPAVMAFVAQEASRRVMCYATANVLREEADQMVVKFADHWKERTGRYPGRLLFDSRATTYAHLDELNRRGVGFITIRRRGTGMIQRVRALPAGQWQHCQVTQAKGRQRPAKYVEETVSLNEYQGLVRQIVFEGLGHDSPTFVLTNDLPERLTAREVLQTYASRNHVEHSLGEKITFFHLDCLASEVRLNVDFDLTLTVVAAMLYHRLAERLKGFAQSTPQTLFRKFVNTQGHIEITGKQVLVHFAKRSHNPILKEAGFDQPSVPVPWLNRKTILLQLP